METKELRPHQQRVVTEKEELDDKLAKLLSFIAGGKGDVFLKLVSEEQGRLCTQARIMKEYSDVLQDRVSAF